MSDLAVRSIDLFSTWLELFLRVDWPHLMFPCLLFRPKYLELLQG